MSSHQPEAGASSNERARQRDQALQWLSKHWGPQRCPICQSGNWNVGDIVATPLLDPDLQRRGWVSTYFPVTCLTCGYTHFFDAVVIGVLEGPTEPLP